MRTFILKISDKKTADEIETILACAGVVLIEEASAAQVFRVEHVPEFLRDKAVATAAFKPERYNKS